MREDRILSHFWFFTKILNSGVFAAILVVFFLVQVGVLYDRGGKDLRVGLYGVEQVLQKRSPYENPTDPHRTIFRYAPGITILEYPFLLNSKMLGPYQFENINPSVFAWFVAKLLALWGSAVLLLKLIPGPSWTTSLWNLKLSFLMAMPLIIYEIINSQNKLIALFFMLLAIFLFERRKMFWAALSFNIALTIYVALLPFLLYFVIREKKFIISFTAAAVLVFLLLPSVVFGFNFNIYLLKEWFTHSLKPFFLTNSYMSYIDLRTSSQSLPSTIGRIFVSGYTGHFQYTISPVLIHIMIRIILTAIVLCSCWAVWKESRDSMRGLGYMVFLILALILPQYCAYYTWSWLFVFYFSVFNYVSHPQVSNRQKKFLLTLAGVLFVSSYLISFRLLNHFSLLFWATLIFWSGIVMTLRRGPGVREA